MKSENQREDIIRNLPAFINQLLLLMNSGLILEWAITRISDSYRESPDLDSSFFRRSVVEMADQSEKSGENIVNLFYSFSRKSGVKELTRVAGILLESRSRGTDIWEKLADTGESIWEERKRLGMEKIRMSESKMSFPLGIMLMALIIITSTPALMQL